MVALSPARMRSLLFLLLFTCAALPTVAAQQPAAAAADSDRVYDKIEVMIPMRDGVRLNTMILTPRGMTENLPIIMLRTPYGIQGGERSLRGNLLAREGYIFAFQDLRGRYQSEGQFVMLRPMRDKGDPRAIDESTDAYDTVEWLLRNVPGNNGRVGMKGVSYPGWTTVMAMLDPHPALKAASPQASPADMFIGDDFHHNGAFRLAYGFEYATLMEGGKEATPFAFGDSVDTYAWYLGLGSLANVNPRYLQGKYPTWNDFVAHPNWDAFWQRQAVTPQIDRPRVPTLNVAGWWDQEDFYGPIKIYRELEKRDSSNLNFLVVGPWNHGGWGGTGQRLGPIDFGSATGRHFRENIEGPFFAYWLKGKGNLQLPEATTFEVGSNVWRAHDDWPPTTNVTTRRLYFHAGGNLSFQPPAAPTDSGFDAYVSDPADPVPYRARPLKPLFQSGSTWSRWLMDDQRFLRGRPDVLNWETQPLAEDITIAGKVMAHLFASTTGSDADWVVKLIDVYPETEADTVLRGYELMVANDVLRGRFRKSFERPDSIVPNRMEEFAVDLHTQNYRFKKGHRIKVQVQSSWFPLIDRNPQTWVPNIYAAKDSDFKAATHRVFRSRNAASHIQVDIVGTEPIRP
jgi:putative CocE/NonD family hydrolase